MDELPKYVSSFRDQHEIYQKAHAKVKAARKAIEAEKVA